jgi:hypothetical protein
VPGYLFEPLRFVDRFAPFFVFRAPFFFVAIVSTLRKRCWWCGAMRARNHLSRTIESAIRAVKEATARTTAIL